MTLYLLCYDYFICTLKIIILFISANIFIGELALFKKKQPAMDFATQKAEYVRTYNKYKGTHSLGRSAKSSHSTEAWILKGLPSEPSKSVNQLLGACGLFNV